LLSSKEKTTALYDKHVNLNAKIINFHGWSMPIWYESSTTEHMNVRNHIGLFDVSHMGQIFISGKNAQKFLQRLTTNDVSRLGVGEGQYTFLCNHQGGIVDDLILYRIKEDSYLLCVNSINIEKDFSWLQKNKKDCEIIEIENQSQYWSQLAVQGPKTLKALIFLEKESIYQEICHLPFNQIRSFSYHNSQCYIARTGYTGEFGFEIYVKNEACVPMWNSILDSGRDFSIKPIGLAARDTLRLEASFFLHGNDINENVSPFEAGAAWAVKLKKNSFIGQEQLIQEKEHGSFRKIFAFKMEDRAIPRHGMNIYQNKKKIGTVTSGAKFPSLDFFGGLALINLENFNKNEVFYIDIRGQEKKAKLSQKPFYKSKAK
tara:strand:+ start:538 stop:1659 length:1122 start_codon:yes stop_codon:yes gene_type:complete